MVATVIEHEHDHEVRLEKVGFSTNHKRYWINVSNFCNYRWHNRRYYVFDYEN